MNKIFLSGLFFLCILCEACREDSSLPSTTITSNFILAPEDLPEYEKNIDHPLLVSSFDDDSYRRGEKIYSTICYTCHGDPGQAGSIPTSTKFWSDKLKNGSHPYAMYETLSRGFGLMPPQVQLVPKQKYDVIHFIRERFIKEDNPDQYFEVDSSYLASLPSGTIEGPSASDYKPWVDMDYGSFLMNTYEIADSTTDEREISGGRSPLANENLVNQNFAYKGLAVRVDNKSEGGISQGEAFVMYDLDLMRIAGAWTGEGFIDYQAILMNERHNTYPRTVGELHFETDVAPGWAVPDKGSFEDPRFKAVDGRHFGPLPYEWTKYRGLYRYEDKVIIEYTVGEAEILESPGFIDKDGAAVFTRTLNIRNNIYELKLRLAQTGTSVHIHTQEHFEIEEDDGHVVIIIPPGDQMKYQIYMSRDQSELSSISNTSEDLDLEKYIRGGPPQTSDIQTTQVIQGSKKEAYTPDVLSLPLTNPWNARVRPTGIDFIPDSDEAVVCTIDGDVWIIENITAGKGELKWQRIATGLFQPLGIVYRDGDIFVTCRDQLVKLNDLNGDREIDHYEAFNTDHQVTEHFHEFAMGLQVDDDGNFYYAKSGRHARDALIPQHGTLIKVSPDGSTSEIIANGFRAANGVCRNPDGSFYVTDQEGYWNPMNRINRVTDGGFYGNMYGYGAPKDTSDTAMEQPLCWIDMRYDRSPSELLWADSDQWGPLNNRLLNISYGYGKVFLVFEEEVEGTMQGGMVQLPLPEFPSGLVRGRFHPEDGQMYACAMTAWATSQVLQAGGLYRIRYTGEELRLPVGLKTLKDGIALKFSTELDEDLASDVKSYTVNTWQLKRSRRYGSKRYDEKELDIERVEIEGNIVKLIIPDISPTWIMEIKYQLNDSEGISFEGAIQGSIFKMPTDSSM